MNALWGLWPFAPIVAWYGWVSFGKLRVAAQMRRELRQVLNG